MSSLSATPVYLGATEALRLEDVATGTDGDVLGITSPVFLILRVL